MRGPLLTAVVVRTVTVATFNTVTLDWSASTRFQSSRRWTLVGLCYGYARTAIVDLAEIVAPVVDLAAGGWASERILIPEGIWVPRNDLLPADWDGTITASNPLGQTIASNETAHFIQGAIRAEDEAGVVGCG